MGLFFENIHIRKNSKFNTDTLKEILTEYFCQNGFTPVADNTEGTVCAVIYQPDNSQWVSVASDIFQFNTEEDIKNTVTPISQCFETDIITAGCYDSDYLRLSLLNAHEGTDGWINIGSSREIKNLRRTSLAPWKNVVADSDKLKNIIKSEHIFAEDAFAEIAGLINMLPEQSTLDSDNTAAISSDKIIKLSFQAPEGTIKLPKLEIPRYSGTPCHIGESEVVSIYNAGGKSKGLGVMFIGDYVANDEITFKDVKLQLHHKDKWEFIPIELKKGTLSDGKKCYYWTDPDFPLPPAVSTSIPLSKRMNLEFEREIGIRFTPVGNPRKVLDIKVVVYPLANTMDGQTCWYVYSYAGNKRDFIEQYNRRWEGCHVTLSPQDLLNPEDYDLD